MRRIAWDLEQVRAARRRVSLARRRSPVKAPTGRAGDLALVIVLDGLRPDSINPRDTPNLFRLREEGVNFTHSHAVFPTGTRVNAAAIATGAYPATNGFVSNALYLPELDPRHSLDTQKYENLLQVEQAQGGRLLLTDSLGEILDKGGMRYAAVAAMSTGGSLLLNHRAASGTGVLVNGTLKPGSRVAYPDDVNRDIIDRFGLAPPKAGHWAGRCALVDWTERVLMEFVIPELEPDVVINWVGEPDHSQHAYGVGSPQARRAMRNVDRNIGYILRRLDSLGLRDRTNLFVISDHGVTRFSHSIEVSRELIAAGLKAGMDSDDIVVADNGPCALLYVKGRNPERIQALVSWLHSREWAGVLFTAGNGPRERQDEPANSSRQGDGVDPHGWVEGTFSLELIHQLNRDRHCDVLLTFPWSSAQNEFGVPGADVTTVRRGHPMHSGHGSMSPWAIRNTLIAYGPAFKRATTIRVPVGHVDLVPTILFLKNVNGSACKDGRVVSEALRQGPDEEQVAMDTRTFITTSPDNAYKAAIQISQVGHHRYIDKGWRLAGDG
ncbi:MAG: alkaline phosphatase family protein [Actinomycetota bacterium]|nr:alkaline phosphatase family protein [Actinomycetota bacterium]